METWWGESQNIEYLKDDDIICVDTAGHGGIGIKQEIAELNNLQERTTKYGGFKNGYYWFEEDCDWIIPFYLCPSWTKYLEASWKKDCYEITKIIFDLAKTHKALKTK